MAEFDLAKPKFKDVYPFISTASLSEAAKGRSVLIVGAGSGIGKAVATSFAQAGSSNIILAGRRPSNLTDVKAELDASGSANVLAIPTDITNATSVDSLFAKIKDAGITLDVLVNSAGDKLNYTSIAASDPGNWWADYEVMLKGPYLTTRAFLRSLTRPEQAPATPTRAIVNVSSSGSNGLIPGSNSYSVPKSALNRLTEYTAAEAAGYGVQAIAMHPGGIPGTGITSRSRPFMMRYYTETAELAAQTVLFLSTERAAWLTGRYVDARWDLEELQGHEERILREDLLKTAILGHARPPVSEEMMKVFASE